MKNIFNIFRSLLRTAHRKLPTAYCKLRTAHRVLPTAYRKLRTAHRKLPTAYCKLRTTHRALPTAYCILLYCLLLYSQLTHAQLYPVQTVHNIIPPYTSKLNDYATSSNVKLRLRLILNDNTINNRQVRLKLKIKGKGFNVQSTDFVVGAPQIFLNGGTQQAFTNIDLSAYFQLRNLVGINAQQYNKPLPDGSYSFCWEVYDFLTNELISNPNMGCDNIFLLLNDPPILNMPNRGDQLTRATPFINFTWTPRHANATNISYEFELREIWDTQIDPQAAFLASPNYYIQTVYATTLVYGMGQPELFPGKTYAWRVRAKSTTGLSENSVFKNDGYSEIYYFTYANQCFPPTMTLAEPLNSGRVKIAWQTHPDHNKYHVQYKRADVADAEWFEVYSYNNQTQIGNLQEGVTYQFRVGGTCHDLTDLNPGFTYSTPNQFTMPTADETVSYSCGIIPEIDISNTTPLGNLGVNENFTAGDFPVTVKEIQGGNGTFSGKGYIVVPYLADTKIAVEFNGIKINTDYQLFDGIIKTTYNPTWSGVESVDGFVNDLGDLINELIDKLKKGQKPTEEEIEKYQAESNDYHDNLNSQIDNLLAEGKISQEEADELKQTVKESQEAFDNSLIASNDSSTFSEAIDEANASKDKSDEVEEAINAANSLPSSYSEEDILAGEEQIDISDFDNNNINVSVDYNNYVAPSGIPITLDSVITPVYYQGSKYNFPKGVVVGFTIGDSIYKAYHYKNLFTGYKTGKNKEPYEFQVIDNTNNLYVTVPTVKYNNSNCKYYQSIYKYNHPQTNRTAKGDFVSELTLKQDVNTLLAGLNNESNGIINTCLPSVSYDSYNNKIFGFYNYYGQGGFLSCLATTKGTLTYVYSGAFGENGEVVYLQFNTTTKKWDRFNTPTSDCLSCDINRLINALYTSKVGHLVLDTAGMAPLGGELFDALNAVWYIIEGDGKNAAISIASTIPLVYATTIKNAGRVIKLADGIYAVIKLNTQATEIFVKTLKEANLSEDALKVLFKDLQNTKFAQALAENPKLVDSWKVIKSVDDPVLAAKAADVAELELVSKYLDDIEAAGGYSNWKAFDDLFSSSRQRVIEKFGKEAEDLIYVKYHDDGGAAAEILDHYGTDGLNALKKASTIDGAASELVKNKTVYRAVNETTYNFDKLKTQGIIDASPVEHPAYVSLDNYTDANIIQQKLQLPKKPTWVAEFDGNQIVNDVRVPNGKFLTAEYKEVLCRSYPEINGVKLEGGGSQFITNSEIKVSKLINLETGEVITFTH